MRLKWMRETMKETREKRKKWIREIIKEGMNASKKNLKEQITANNMVPEIIEIIVVFPGFTISNTNHCIC